MPYTLPRDDSTAKIPYLANLDSNNVPAIPTEQYIKANGLYVPVSSSNPLPTQLTGSNVATYNMAPGTLTPVLLPENYPSTGWQGGAASPKVFYDSIAKKIRMMFTGFSQLPPTSGIQTNARSVYLADIDSNLNVSNITKIVDAAAFGSSYTGFGGADPYYDIYNSEWIITCTLYGASGGNYAGYFTMKPDFSAVVDTLTVVASPSDAYQPADSGMQLIMGYDKTATLWWVCEATDSAGRHNIVKARVADFTARPWSITVAEQDYWMPLAQSSMNTPDVIFAQQYRGGMLLLAETQGYAQPWNIAIGYTPEVPWSNNTNNWQEMNPIIAQSKLIPNGAAGIVNAGHPFYTDVLGFPCLFFVQFRDTFHTQYSYHEIWAYRLPDDWLDKKLFPASGASSYATYGSCWYPTFGRDVIVEGYLESGATDCNLVVQTAGSFNDGSLTSRYQEKTAALTAGSGATVSLTSPDSLMWVKATFSATAGLTADSRITIHVS